MLSVSRENGRVRSRCMDKGVWTHALCTSSGPSNGIPFSSYTEASSSLNISHFDSGPGTRHVLDQKDVTWTRRREQHETLSGRHPKLLRGINGLFLSPTGQRLTVPWGFTLLVPVWASLTSAQLFDQLSHFINLLCYKYSVPLRAGMHPRSFTLHLGLCFLSSPGCFLSCLCPHCYCQIF